MRLVVDTNVLVSGLLTPSGTTGQILLRILEADIRVVYSRDISLEYERVLRHAKFRFLPDDISKVMAAIYGLGEITAPRAQPNTPFSDPSDIPFFAAALDAGCPLVTENQKHFPHGAGVDILSPAEILQRLRSNP